MENKMFSIFPTISRVQNHGHDGSGINCFLDEKSIKKYGNQKIQIEYKEKLNMPVGSMEFDWDYDEEGRGTPKPKEIDNSHMKE
jgi:hypothetical protein